MAAGNFRFSNLKQRLTFGKSKKENERGLEVHPWKDAMPIWVDARAHIRSFDGNVYDVTEDIIEGTISRGIDAPMTLSITIGNAKNKYAQQFIPDDQIVVWLRRGENEFQAFTGYIKRLPMGHLFTNQEVTLEAECIIRRLKTKYWDSQMPESVIALSSSPQKEFLISPDQTLAFLLTAPEYVGLDPKDVFIQRFPEIWIDRAAAISEKNMGCAQTWDEIINCDDPCGASEENAGGGEGYSGGPITEFPGCDAGKAKLACWMATNSRKAGLPGTLIPSISLMEMGMNCSGHNASNAGGPLFGLTGGSSTSFLKYSAEEGLKNRIQRALKFKNKYNCSEDDCGCIGRWAHAMQVNSSGGSAIYTKGCPDVKAMLKGCKEPEEDSSANVFGLREGDPGFEESHPVMPPEGSGPGSGGERGLGTEYVLGVEKPAYVLSHFLDGKSSIQKPNKGMDVAAKGGNTVRAWGAGRVLLNGHSQAYNHYTVVELNNTPVLFTNLKENSTLEEGSYFGTGAIIGRVGNRKELGIEEPFVHIEVFPSKEAAINLDSSESKNPAEAYNPFDPILPRGKVYLPEKPDTNYRRFIPAPIPEEDVSAHAYSPDEYVTITEHGDRIVRCGCTECYDDDEDQVGKAAPGNTPQPWHLVRNRKIRYKLNTSYGKAFKTAARRWGSLGGVAFEEVQSGQDVLVTDGNLGGPLGATYPSGRIVFDDSEMKGATQNARDAAAAHEIGHALGFNHQSREPSVMYPSIITNRNNNNAVPTDYDIKLYREVWGGKGTPEEDNSGNLDQMTRDGLEARCSAQVWGGGHDEEDSTPTGSNIVSGGKVQPYVQKAAEDIKGKFPNAKASTYKGHQPSIDRAIDWFDSPSTMQKIANYAAQNWKNLNIDYVIYKQKFWAPYKNMYGGAGKWSPMPDRGSPTQNHMDHVHMSFKGSANVMAEVDPDVRPKEKKNGVDATGLFNRLRMKQGLVPGEVGGLADWFDFLVGKEPFLDNKLYPQGTMLINPGNEGQLGHLAMVIDDEGTVLDVNAHTRIVNTKFNIYESNQGWEGYTHVGYMPDVGWRDNTHIVDPDEDMYHDYIPDFDNDPPLESDVEGEGMVFADNCVPQPLNTHQAGGGNSYAHVGKVNTIIENKFGVNGTTYPNHGVCGGLKQSVDWMVGAWRKKASGKAKEGGDAIAGFLESNWSAFNIKYMIWWGKIASSPGGWKTYKGGGNYGFPTSVTGRHEDHIHVTFERNGTVGEYKDDGKIWTGINTGGAGGGEGGGEVNGYDEPCIMKNPLGAYRLFNSLGDMAYSMALRRISLGLSMYPDEEYERRKWDLLGYPQEAYLEDLNTEIRDWSQLAELRKEPYMAAIQDVASAGLYSMQSLGTGEIVFWYPDIYWGLEDWVLEDLKEEKEDIVQNEIPGLKSDIARLERELAGHEAKIKDLNEQIEKDEKTIRDAGDSMQPGEGGLIGETINRNARNKTLLQDELQKLQDKKDLLNEKKQRVSEIDEEIRDREDVSGLRFDTENVEILTRKMLLRDIELEDFHLYVSDEELCTHYYCAGDFQMEGSFSDTPPFIPCWRWSTIFNHPFFKKMAAKGLDWNPRAFIQKYGSRPKKEVVNAIKTPGMAQIWADYEFLKQWLRCYTVELKTAFLPELYPGQSLEIESLGIVVHVNDVSHSFGSTWETTISCSMPLAVGDSVTDSQIPPLPFWSLIPTSYLEEEDLQRYTQDSEEAYITEPLGEGELYDAIQEKRARDREVVKDYLEYWKEVNKNPSRRQYEEEFQDGPGFVPRLNPETGEWEQPEGFRD